MSKTVNIIVDASGSMAEDDKNAVVKYMINCICNAKQTKAFSGVEFILFQWGNNSVKFDKLEKAKLEYKGKISFDDLAPIKGEIEYDDPMILISDGGFERNDILKIKKLSRQILPVFVGVDADRSALKDIAIDKIVYSAADLMQALSEAKCSLEMNEIT